jgi:hypothetical protein
LANVALPWRRAGGVSSSAETILQVKYSLILFFASIAFLRLYPNGPLQDADTYWHIATGANIWRTGQFPRTDEYSFTMSGSPWIAKEWLSQLIFYFAYRFGGWSAVSLTAIVTASTAYVVLFSWLLRRVKPIVALTMAMVSISLTTESLLARPQIFFYLLLCVTVCGLVGAVESRKTPWWLIPVTALWANMHASFPIAFVLAFLFGLEAIVSSPPAERRRTTVKWASVTLGAVAAAGATPYGYEPLFVSTKIVGSSATDYIDEWKPAGFGVVGVYGAAFLAGSLAIVFASRISRLRLAPLAICGGLMLRHVRFFSLFGFVVSASLATPVAKLFPRFAAQRRAPSATERKWSSIALATLAAMALAATAFLPRPHPVANITPQRALETARRLNLAGPVFNDYKYGGYLIFEGVKTFIDGRAEVYMDGFFQELAHAEVAPDSAHFFAMLDRYHVTWALISKDSGSLAAFRKSKQWLERYHDDSALVFEKVAS